MPRSQGTASLRLIGESDRTFALFFRWAGAQYDDDRNLFELGPMRQLDAFAALPFSGSFDLVAAGENLLNYRYEMAHPAPHDRLPADGPIGRPPAPRVAPGGPPGLNLPAVRWYKPRTAHELGDN